MNRYTLGRGAQQPLLWHARENRLESTTLEEEEEGGSQWVPSKRKLNLTNLLHQMASQQAFGFHLLLWGQRGIQVFHGIQFCLHTCRSFLHMANTCLHVIKR